MQGRGNARFPCTPSPKPTSTTNKNRLAARTGKKLGCGNDARWNPWKSPTPTFPPLPPHLEIPQQTRDSHIPTATTTTGYRGLDQHQTKINTKANTNNKTKVVYTDNLTHPGRMNFCPSPMSTLSLLCPTNSPHWRCRTRRFSMTSCSAPVPRPYKRLPKILATWEQTSASFRSCIPGGRTYCIILTSTASFPPVDSRPTAPTGFIPATPSSSPSTYSVASSAASSSPA